MAVNVDDNIRKLSSGQRKKVEVRAAVAVGLFGLTRATGLADLGRRVDLVERSIRRCKGDPAFAEALRRDTEGRRD